MKDLIYYVAAALVMLLWLDQAEARTEAEHRDEWCAANGGVKTNGSHEYRLSDGTWIDCFTFFHAIEVERASNWYPSIGQALHYARITGSRPGILLILETEAEMLYLYRLLNAIAYWSLPVDVWTTGVRELRFEGARGQ